MAPLLNVAEGRNRVEESVQQPKYPVESGVEYGLVRPVVIEVVRRVATFDPPQSWLALPEHRVVQVVAATEGRVFPQEQESARQLKSEMDTN
jgi:hypothetical protein